MAKTRSIQNMQLSSFEDLFGNAPQGDIIEVSLDELRPFKEHPFKVLDNADMDALVESIRLHGKVLQPGLVRACPQGGYELISGHRRAHASAIVGLKTMPVIVKELTDEEATIIMVDSNLHREELLPSEKAFAYKMKFEALSHPGSHIHGRAAEQIASEANDSARNVQRYIRLTELTSELLELVDAGKLPVYIAVELSYLSHDEQNSLCAKLAQGGRITNEQAQQLRKYSQDGQLNDAVIELTLQKEKPVTRKFTLKQERINQYFKAETSEQEIEAVILGLLEKWKGGEIDV